MTGRRSATRVKVVRAPYVLHAQFSALEDSPDTEVWAFAKAWGLLDYCENHAQPRRLCADRTSQRCSVGESLAIWRGLAGQAANVRRGLGTGREQVLTDWLGPDGGDVRLALTKGGAALRLTAGTPLLAAIGLALALDATHADALRECRLCSSLFAPSSSERRVCMACKANPKSYEASRKRVQRG